MCCFWLSCLSAHRHIFICWWFAPWTCMQSSFPQAHTFARRVESTPDWLSAVITEWCRNKVDLKINGTNPQETWNLSLRHSYFDVVFVCKDYLWKQASYIWHMVIWCILIAKSCHKTRVRQCADETWRVKCQGLDSIGTWLCKSQAILAGSMKINVKLSSSDQ